MSYMGRTHKRMKSAESYVEYWFHIEFCGCSVDSIHGNDRPELYKLLLSPIEYVCTLILNIYYTNENCKLFVSPADT
jgi:hypothetical protein